MVPSDAAERYLLVSTGRSGSSLLAAICATAGGEFGMTTAHQWDRAAGANEHPLLIEAYKWSSRAGKLANSLLPEALGRGRCEQRANDCLRRWLSQATFGKSTTLVWLVHPIAALGYTPKVIVPYRPFSEYALSRYLRFGLSYRELQSTYLNVYGTALTQLRAFGGCTVSMQELADPAAVEWAAAVAGLTGLDEARLLAARGEIVKPRRHVDEDFLADDETDRMYARLREFQGQIVTPHRAG